jgi:phage terminase small subunit
MMQVETVLKSSRPAPAKWLSRKAKAIFETLTDDLIEAGVMITRADTHALSMAAVCLDNVASAAKDQSRARLLQSKTEASKLVARYKKEAAAAARNLMRFERDAMTWLSMLAATPRSRARFGIKPKQKKTGAVANLLQARQRQ